MATRPGVGVLYRNNAELARRRGGNLLRMRLSAAAPAYTPGTGTLTVTRPSAYQVCQRSTATTGTIRIIGTYTGQAGPIEASFNGGAWTTIVPNPSDGTFDANLANQAAGQGTLSVRWVGEGGNTVTINTVGIGDVFVCIGQSNMSGMADSNQSYSHATLKACLFGNDYVWKELADPYDSTTSQVDTVSREQNQPGGSFIPPLATSHLASQGVPCAFVPCSLGGSAIESWQPGSNHQDRSTLYGSTVYRALQVGGCKVVLCWQGEEDCIRGTSQAQYNTWLDALANAVYADLGVKLMPCTIEILNGAGWNWSTTNVNAAIAQAWSDNSNVLTGPDFSASDWGGAHYGAGQIAAITSAWWTAIRTAFGWSA